MFVPIDVWNDICAFIPSHALLVAIRCINRYTYSSIMGVPMLHHWRKWHRAVCSSGNVKAAKWVWTNTMHATPCRMPFAYATPVVLTEGNNHFKWSVDSAAAACVHMHNVDALDWLFTTYGHDPHFIHHTNHIFICIAGEASHNTTRLEMLMKHMPDHTRKHAARTAVRSGQLRNVQLLHCIMPGSAHTVRLFTIACKHNQAVIVHWLSRFVTAPQLYNELHNAAIAPARTYTLRVLYRAWCERSQVQCNMHCLREFTHTKRIHGSVYNSTDHVIVTMDSNGHKKQRVVTEM